MTTIRGSYDMGMAMIKVGKWTIEQQVSLWRQSTAIEVEGRSIYVGMPVGGGTCGLSHQA